jgi:hypothetical protein
LAGWCRRFNRPKHRSSRSSVDCGICNAANQRITVRLGVSVMVPLWWLRRFCPAPPLIASPCVSSR